nr:putative zinc finger, CCHC-type [Tanacetum cinerariifolium]
MKEGESIDDFASKLSGLALKARSLGYEHEEEDLVKRILDSMPNSFLHIVASIEQCFDLDSMLFDEAVGRLKAYEERIKGAEKMEDTQGGWLLASDRRSHEFSNPDSNLHLVSELVRVKGMCIKSERERSVKAGGFGFGSFCRFKKKKRVEAIIKGEYNVVVKVKSIMDAHGLWGTMEPRTLGEESNVKKSKQALAFLFKAIPENMVLQMASYTDPKQMWDGLKTYFLGVDWVRTAQLATLNRELESLHLVKRLVDSMPKSFLWIVDSIEQCFKLDSMLFDKAVGRLKVYEEHIKGSKKMEDTQGGLLLASDRKSHGCKRRDRGRGRESKKSRDDSVKRLLDSMPKSLLQIVASIKQCFVLDSMLCDEAVGRLKAYVERIKGAERWKTLKVVCCWQVTESRTVVSVVAMAVRVLSA